jgi:hypothetical protein
VEAFDTNGDATGDNIIWRVRFACWVSETAGTLARNM